MKVLITGICGFVGTSLASELPRRRDGLEILGVDNLSRAGSEYNRARLRQQGIRVFHGDLRHASDLEALPRAEWVIDAAANPSVLAGVGGQTSSRQLMEHNLVGTLQALEYCKRHRAGLIVLSTSRVYSLERLASLPLEVRDRGFVPRFSEINEPGLSPQGVAEGFSTTAPLSLYGAAKLASEIAALEYGLAFDFPVHVNRCGVLAGAGQFGKPDQGIFSFWIHSYRGRRPLKYIGFNATGHQVRDCLDPRDLAALVERQLGRPTATSSVINVSGGVESAMSLAQLTDWCAARFGPMPIQGDSTERRYDVPWLVLDSSLAEKVWDWRPAIGVNTILEEIAAHAATHPDWLDLSADPWQ